MTIEPIFKNEDYINIDKLNNQWLNDNPNVNLPIQRKKNSSLDLVNSLLSQSLNKVVDATNTNILLTPLSFYYTVIVYLERMEKRNVIIQVEKGTLRGGALEVKKVVPPTIDDFCKQLRITKNFFNKLKDNELYKESISLLNDGVNSVMLTLGTLGSIKENMTKFYLVNNSDYKDVSSIEHIDNNKVLPSWMSKDMKIINNNDTIEEVNVID